MLLGGVSKITEAFEMEWQTVHSSECYFGLDSALRAIELADALVGAQTALQPQHGMLKYGTYAFVIVENQLYDVVQDISYRNFNRSFIIDTLYFK
jgi:hypothetical protein